MQFSSDPPRFHREWRSALAAALTSSCPDLEFSIRKCRRPKTQSCRSMPPGARLKRIRTESSNESVETASFEGDRQEQYCSMPIGLLWSSSWKEMKTSVCLRAPRKARKRAGTRMSSFLSNCSTTTARSASSSTALAGRLQSWRSRSSFQHESF